MQPTVDLICTIFKYCLLLVLLRLVSSALNWEFGVSRQYLRLLEWVLERGQKRIERAQSEHKLVESQDNADNDGHQSEPEYGTNANSGTSNAVTRPSELGVRAPSNNGAGLKGIKFEPAKHGCKLATADLQPATAAEKERMRRVSTPDGPPVFLLDHLDDDHDDDDHSDKGGGPAPVPLVQQHEFHMEHAARFVVRGVSAIIDDQVTKRFTPEQLKTWNLLTRTNAKNYHFMSRSLGLCWLSGLVIRYAVLLPLRILFTVTAFVWLACSMALIGLLPGSLRTAAYKLVSLMSFRLLACGITSRLSFHNRQYRARNGDVCVANHTSPIDVILMGCDNSYALVGQRHGGLLGLLELVLSRAAKHVWFDRAEIRDRQLVTRRLKQHLSNKSNLPVLIFPEGTCINNSAVMMFRKGSFETTDRICPATIKYDARFGDPFWNSSKQGYVHYLLMMMSSWAIKCDVWYLPPMERMTNESSAEFANRVKAEIARQGGLDDLAWDGQLKRSSVKPTWIYQQQEDYAKRLKLE